MGSGATTGPVPPRQTLYGPHRGLFGEKKIIIICVYMCMSMYEVMGTVSFHGAGEASNCELTDVGSGNQILGSSSRTLGS